MKNIKNRWLLIDEYDKPILDLIESKKKDRRAKKEDIKRILFDVKGIR